MAPFPTPKAEMIISRQSHVIRILTASADARKWIEKEAPQFGELMPMTGSPGEYALFVSELWDYDEVETYLRSYLDR